MTATTQRTSQGRWPPGKSGNPSGRKPGSSPTARLRAAIGSDLVRIVERLRDQALAGDTSAARLLLDRLCPALRPVDDAAPLSLPTDGHSAALAVAHAVALGSIAPDRGRAVLAALDTAAGLADLAELVRRIENVERRLADTGGAP
jgi:hypothetical protein